MSTAMKACELHLRALLLALAVALSLAGCGTIYQAEALEGWVVDAETGKPLEGVIIVANWELRGGFEGSTPLGNLNVLETVTDASGRYSFPAWGPRIGRGHLGVNSPGLWLFKPGYRPAGISGNPYYHTMGTSSSFYHGKTLKLEPFRGTPGEYARNLSRLNDSLWRVGHARGKPCDWKSFPRMLQALDAQAAELRRAGINEGSVVSRLRANDEQLKAAGCGSVEEVIKR